MISSAVINALVAAGCSAEQLAAAVNAAASEHEVAAEAKRAKDRDRKRVERDAKKAALSAAVAPCPTESEDVQGNPRTAMESTDIMDNGSSLSPVPLLSPIPPNNPLTPKPISKNQTPRAHRLPENASIAGPDLAYGLSRGLTECETGELWQRMASWAWSAGGANAKKINWHQAFQGWVQRDGPGIIAARRNPSGKPLTEHQRKQHETQDILHAMDNFAGRSNEGRSPNLELLPDYSGERPEDVRGRIGQGSGGIPGGRH